MVDLTRDEWDDMQEGYDPDGCFSSYPVQCARCRRILDAYDAFLEEGDEWECEPCNIRCDARAWYLSRDREVDEDFDDLFPLAGEAIAKHLLKG
jgi:hypothetical protein